MKTIEDVYRVATGHEPYPWQRTLAESPLPEALVAETGSGKTAGVALAWIYRRRFHPDKLVRSTTPRKLAFVLPARTLVEQTLDSIREWASRLDVEDTVPVVCLMGGEPIDREWQLHPERECIIVGTLDMVLSRCLNRGYGQSRYMWPVDFGLLNSDTHFVYDEVQLMGPAAQTSRQLQAFRDRLGTAAQTSSTWMTATLDVESLQTVDAPTVTPPIVLSEADRSHPHLRQRLDAARTIIPWGSPSAKNPAADRAAALVEAHAPHTLTIAVLNTVKSARELYSTIAKLKPEAEVLLLHSRYRPEDRRRQFENLQSALPEAGRIVISTQVIEAGVDISATLLATEAAPWSSIVQRIGRCNRDGQAKNATVMWAEASKSLPYEDDDVQASVDVLRALENTIVTTASLATMDVPQPLRFERTVIRRRDMVALFDTAPDLAGNDIDISPYVRPDDERDVSVLWRDLEDVETQASPQRDELCSVSIAEFRDFCKKMWTNSKRRPLAIDHTGLNRSRRGASEDIWVPVEEAQIRPGQVYLLDTSMGGYTADGGWDPKVKGIVSPVLPEIVDVLAPMDEPYDAESATTIGVAQGLSEHLSDVAAEVAHTLSQFSTPGLSEEMRNAAIEAARWHDLGKAHPAFQTALSRRMTEPATGLLAKSGSTGRLLLSPRGFRHEFASALALMGSASTVLDGLSERNLAVYLVASHHGKVRVTLRPNPFDETAGDETPRLLGVTVGDSLPDVDVDGITAPGGELHPEHTTLGEGSWSAITIGLRDRDDLGIFRIGFLEAIVRAADWRASARVMEAK